MRKCIAACLAAAMVLGSAARVGAGETPVTQRRVFGVLFLGSGALLAKRAFDFQDDADRLFELYELAGTAEEAARLFEKTQDRDTKSQLAGALSAVMVIAGVRLLLSSGTDANIPKLDRGLRVRDRVRLDLGGDPRTGRLGVIVNREF